MGGVIELDPAAPWEPEPPSTPRRVPRWLPPVVVVVTTLVTVTAAVAPVRRDPVLSLREANTTLHLGPDDTAYVMTQRTRSTRLQAYPPGRTRPLWTVNFPGGHVVAGFVDDPGVLMLTVFDADPTGRRTSVQVRDAGTGQLRWARPVAPDGLVAWNGGTVIELDPNGRLRLDDAVTGATRHEVRLALTGLPFHARIDGGLLVVDQHGARLDEPVSVAYDLGSGAERRRETTQLSDGCGDRWRCVDESGQLTVADAATDIVRYRGSNDRHIVRGDRLIVSSMPAVTEIHDLRTGRRAHALRGWALAGYGKTSNLVIQQLAGSGLLVADVDAATGRLTVLGRTTDWAGSATCYHGVGIVGCHGTAGVRVWRLRQS